MMLINITISMMKIAFIVLLTTVLAHSLDGLGFWGQNLEWLVTLQLASWPLCESGVAGKMTSHHNLGLLHQYSAILCYTEFTQYQFDFEICIEGFKQL